MTTIELHIVQRVRMMCWQCNEMTIHELTINKNGLAICQAATPKGPCGFSRVILRQELISPE